jgi:hypothetical protein
MQPEPEAGQVEVAKLSIRLPNGERILRRFKASDKMEVNSYSAGVFENRLVLTNTCTKGNIQLY